MSHPYRIMTVCTGNICRSPMAEVVLRQRLADAGLADRVEVFSTGTSAEEEGNPIDPRARRELARRGYDVPQRRARKVTSRDLESAELVLAATAGHVRSLERVGADSSRVHLIRSFDPESGERDLADPWWGGPGEFELCLDQIEASADGVVDFVRERLDP